MNEKRFTLRMNADLFELVKQSAERNKRSTAKEIEFIIEDFLKKNNILPDESKE
ncbi:Arc family DNA-binding protein [Megamonas funiformis]|uniref:Arc family DNA-binding protein n=1 Tax=Megamonas funiformis TaxID=437897 RepID=UPI00351FC868